MNASQKHIIRDYLRRYVVAYVLGLLIHLLVAIGLTHHSEIPLFGLFLGSAFVLGIEFVRGGNTTSARTLLAMPVTASQLARVWRFVAMILPIVLYFVVLLVGVLIGKATGGNKLSLEGFVVLALLQTGMLGMFFFSLTGLQPAPAPGAGFGEKCSNLIFGVLWGFSIPVVMFTPQLQMTSTSQLTSAHFLAWVFLIVVTVAGWFRAETLVARRTVRNAGNVRKAYAPRVKGAMPWRQYGGLRYFMSVFGSAASLMFIMMLGFTWFGTNYLFGGPSVGHSMDSMQLHMFVAIAGLITVLQVLPMLRFLRTMPKRGRSFTHLMILWPLGLIVFLSIVGYGLHSIVAGQEFVWESYGIRIARCIAGGTFVLLALPLFLRFGFNIKSVVGMMLFVSVSNTFEMVIERDLKVAEAQQWLVIGIVLGTVLPVAWFLTHRTLRSEHPWRIKSFRFGAVARVA